LLSAVPVFLVLAASAPATPDWRYGADPRDAAEQALRDAALVDGSAGIAALRAVSDANPGTTISGLARLAAGLDLLDDDRAKEALIELTHPDVATTPLRDRALFAEAQAREALRDVDGAAGAYLAAAGVTDGTVACAALPEAAGLLTRAGRTKEALPVLEQVAASCPDGAPAALLALGEARLRTDPAGAAAALDALDRQYPTSPEAKRARARLKLVASHLPPRTAEERSRQALEIGLALLEANLTSEAITSLRAVSLGRLPPADADRARVALGRALVSRGRLTEGRGLLRKVVPPSEHAAEAAYWLARDRARRARVPQPYEEVANRFAGTPWAEEALLALANHYQKDALDQQALPWWRRLLSDYPQGRYVEKATWRVGWADLEARRYEAAAQTFETTARLRPPGTSTPGFLYWSARARLELGQSARAMLLLQETVQRYKYAYHGLRARELLTRLGGASPDYPTLVAATPPDEPALPEPQATRLRDLLLIDRPDEAAEELRRVPDSARVRATLAWIDWTQGRLRPAITGMKRAFPHWVGEAGDQLPSEVWRILFPLRFEEQLRQAAQQEGLDSSLVAALILQESTFDHQARSRVGARGLMQVMPATGRRIARDKGVRYRRAALTDPETSLDFGTHYLRKMSDRFSGEVERVLAAYNAGPHRVDAWTAVHGDLGSEEFIETIPFTETRFYVMTVLANREQYRRLYGLGRPAPTPVVEGARP
jgi:soluble lytic murein transglycosylase